MAIDHGHENIRVNCICPSIVETELVKGLFDASGQGQALAEGAARHDPSWALRAAVDVAEMAVFLASENRRGSQGRRFRWMGG